MKIKRVSEHIWSIKSWVLIPIHVWIVEEEDGVTLVDAGMPFLASGILKFINQLDSGPLKRILLTHGHGDHVGALTKILQENNVPVYAHEIEIPFMEGNQLYPRRKKYEKNVAKGIVQPLQSDEQDRLLSVSGLHPILTPGHSPGHVVYYHEEDQVLLAGDLFTSKRGKLHRPMPMFTGDMKEAVKSSVVVEQLNPKQLEVCHGNTVYQPAKQLDEYMKKMESELLKRIG
ncbi:MBL fold metallo-hydrolase [Oceanobacillus saliphilus]|uniref:MBL fold metallo-hydrolase n=1 Tax=Oceanobacillus saliphilus TaxID=2925834 RepID=UPI00201D70CA|nr:MBL fold metallo-hydrolase [Oceanobacillus saliphilus]